MPTSAPPDRFRPHAAREMAGMFDHVSRRYDFLNRWMTLGQDRAWRHALARLVPSGARRVMDLCTGNGVSLEGLVRPGRLVLGVDVSLGMLRDAEDEAPAGGWRPRLACADAFRLPLADGAVDAVTIAFGIRNLRPRFEALTEIARVLVPGGTLGVLEATAPRPGALAPLHRFWLRRVLPLLGRISDDPSAYRYLGESILEFGPGEAFEAELARAGFRVTLRRRYLLGAAALWSATYEAERNVAGGGRTLHGARPDGPERGISTHRTDPGDVEWRIWTVAQLVLSGALTAALIAGIWIFAKWSPVLTLEAWQRLALWVLLVGGAVGFTARTVLLLVRATGPRPGG